MAASRQQEPGSRARVLLCFIIRDTSKCVTRYKNGEKYKVCVFRYYGKKSNLHSYSVARCKQQENNQQPVKFSRVKPSYFQPNRQSALQLFLFTKNGEKCEMRVFRCCGTRSRTASSTRNTDLQVGYARARTLACSLITGRPRRFSLTGP